MKALPESSWGFTTETLMSTYRAIVRPILNYAAPIWLTQVSSLIWANLRWFRTKLCGSWLLAIKRPRLPTSEPRLGSSPCAVRTVLSAVLRQRPPTNAPQSPSRHFPFRPRRLRATLQASCHSNLGGLRVRGVKPNSLSFIFGGMLEECDYPWVRLLLRGWMIEEIFQSQASNKVLMATPPPIDPAKQLLPRSCPTVAPSSSSIPATAQASSPKTTPKAGPMTPPAPIATQPTTLCPISLAAPHIPWIWSLGDMWVAPLQVAQFLAGLPQLVAICLHCRSTLTPNPHSCCWPPSLEPLAGPHLLHHTPSHFTHGPEVISPSAIQQTTICCCWFWMAILIEEWSGERWMWGCQQMKLCWCLGQWEGGGPIGRG